MKDRHTMRTGQGHSRLAQALILALLLGTQGYSIWGQDAGDSPPPGEQPTSYKAKLNGQNVHIRSGPGTHFYDCGTLNRNDTVEVWGEEGGWSKITPPPGSFSWIATKHIGVDAEQPTVGIVTGKEAIVYAGSDFVIPMHSTTRQVVLHQKEKVHLLNEEKDGYLKISPPANSYLWVSSQYLDPLTRPAPENLPQEPAPPAAVVEQVDTTVIEPAEPAVVDTTPEGLLLAEYYAIQDRVEEQLAKPMEEQDYTEIETALATLAANEESEKVAKYAQILASRIDGYKLAIQVGQEVAVQDKLLQEATQRISRATSQRRAEIPKLGRFAVIGIFKQSNLNLKRYRILAPSGKTLCYAEPIGGVAGETLGDFLDKKVGLIGSIKAHAPSKSALVEFTKIELVD